MSETRDKILQSVYKDMCMNGFQGMRADKLMVDLKITKGALYYHFPSKLDIGYAVVDEILLPEFTQHWQPLRNFSGNPIEFIMKGLHIMQNHYNEGNPAVGCPLNNLIQEMSPLDEGFRKRLQNVVDDMHQSICNGLENGIKNGFVNKNVNPQQTAFFILASIEGSYSMAKVRNNPQIFSQNMQMLSQYLNSLRA